MGTKKCIKVCFDSYKLAKVRIAEIQVEAQGKPAPIRPYKCPYCKYYHLTKKSGKQFERTKKHFTDLAKALSKVPEKIQSEANHWLNKLGIREER